MALRKNITHGLTFKTVPDEMRGIDPSDYIGVETGTLPDEKMEVGSVSADLEVMLVDDGNCLMASTTSGGRSKGKTSARPRLRSRTTELLELTI